MSFYPIASGEPQQSELRRADALFRLGMDQISRHTDRLFAGLMVVQWIAAIIAALVISPRTWEGTTNSIHPHLLAAIFLGGAISGLGIYMGLRHSGKVATRHTIAICQMLMSALLIDLTGGRIETHFHVFGSLAFLAFYRDWRVLITATVVVALDHIIRGSLWPQTVFGVFFPQPWRWVEHAAWCLFEDAFLIVATAQQLREMRRSALRQARLEATEADLLQAHDHLEEQVAQRTSELIEANESLVKQMAERDRAEETVRWQSYHDALTGLPNRTMFNETLMEQVDNARKSGEPISVMHIDLDRFKYVNDTYGHSYGDIVLCEASSRIRGCLQCEDVLARVGGDEFTVMLPGRTTAEAAKVARSILSEIIRPVRTTCEEMSIGCSVGISGYPTDATDADTMLQHANSAMTRAQGSGGGCLRVYTDEMGQNSREHLELEAGLRYAVERGELVLHYQPQISFETGSIVGVEALLRWRHPELGLVSPGKFIPVAEETGLIVPIGKWVLEEACRQAMIWYKAGHRFRMSVNLSGRQFEQNDVVAVVDSVLRSNGVPHGMVDIELTESAVMSRGEAAIDTMHAFKALGINLAVDDFGTGYSSLSYLRHFPLDILKIDRTFVIGVESNDVDVAIVKAVVDLAHAIGLTVVVEGVETEEQADILRGLRCDVMQGFLFSRPLPVADLEELLRRQAEAPEPKTILRLAA